jgi:thymidylate synthase (FAD)
MEIKDEFFRVEVISRTPYPQTAIWFALHQDYSEDFVYDQTPPSEEKAGEVAVKRLLDGKRGHWGCCEHPQIIFNVGYYPHSVMQQARTHREGISFDVQSCRYSGQRFIDVAEGKRSIESVFYLRPVGYYHDRFGHKYLYSEEQREEHLGECYDAACRYKRDVDAGLSPEHARSMIPFDFRQHFVVSMNMRSLAHFLLIRGKKDAQLEIQQLAWLMLPHFKDWAPQVYEWFMENEWLKGFLAP